jgi:hypothetical protein
MLLNAPRAKASPRAEKPIRKECHENCVVNGARTFLSAIILQRLEKVESCRPPFTNYQCMNGRKTSAERRAGARASHTVLAVLIGAFGLALLSACQSQPQVDHRPGWVRDAEARLQKEPSWETSGPGVAYGGGQSEGSSFFGSGRQSTSANSTPTERTTTAPPPGVRWSDTQISVQVEK